jgi:hypothetical protein
MLSCIARFAFLLTMLFVSMLFGGAYAILLSVDPQPVVLAFLEILSR